jgi:hypothetical protein
MKNFVRPANLNKVKFSDSLQLATLNSVASRVSGEKVEQKTNRASSAQDSLHRQKSNGALVAPFDFWPRVVEDFGSCSSRAAAQPPPAPRSGHPTLSARN